MKRLAVSFLATILIGTAAVYSQSVGPVCPNVDVNGPPVPVNHGETATFYADVSGKTTGLKYRWSVDKGTILSGQGTPVIQVGVTNVPAGRAIRASVEIEGLQKECESVYSDTVEIISGGSPSILDEIPSVTTEALIGRINSAVVRLETEFGGEFSIVFVTYGLKTEADGRERIIKAKTRATLLNPDKVAFLYGGAGDLKTRILVLKSAQTNSFSSKGDSDCICFDRVGEESADRLTGKLKNFLYELTKNPGKIGFILTHGTAREAHRREKLIRDYLYLIRLTNNTWLRRISEAKVVLINAGDSDSLWSNFVIADKASEYSKCRCDEEQPKCPKIRVIGPQLVAQPDATIRFRLEIDGRDLPVERSIDKGIILERTDQMEIVVGGTDKLAVPAGEESATAGGTDVLTGARATRLQLAKRKKG